MYQKTVIRKEIYKSATPLINVINILHTYWCMFGHTARKIDFVRIDSVKFILAKVNLNIKWFIFGYIYAKVG
jgi:hypothetical protein